MQIDKNKTVRIPQPGLTGKSEMTGFAQGLSACNKYFLCHDSRGTKDDMRTLSNVLEGESSQP